MGYQKSTLRFLVETLQARFPRFGGVRMVELGNQWMRPSCELYDGPTANFWRALGVHYTSIDINGKNGALALDLNKDQKVHHLQGHVLTNIGFTEHVADQYQCFKLLHELVLPGGITVHDSPGPNGNEWEHTPVRYTVDFYTALADRMGYRLELCLMTRHEIRTAADRVKCLTVHPDTPVPFMSREEFCKLPTIPALSVD
jgi:hypothetical protein